MTRINNLPTMTHSNTYSHPPPSSAPSSTSSAPHSPRPRFFHKSKSSSQHKAKAQKVQINLELKVEKAKGFAAFFSIPVPSGRAVPRAPPSSPVLCATATPKIGNIQQVEYMDLCRSEKHAHNVQVQVQSDVEPMVLC